MAAIEKTSAVEPLLPVKLGANREIHYARGMKAGRWVFTTGNLAQDFEGGISPEVISAELPHGGKPKHEKEASRVYDNIEEVLKKAGTELPNIVRLDQYYPTWKAVDPYHVVRRARLGKHIPPSTSMVMQGLLLPDAAMDVQAIAIVPEGEFRVQHIENSNLAGHPTSGYSPALRAGDFIFVAGVTPSPLPGAPGRRGMAEEAQIPEGALWRGQAIKLETEYIVKKKILPSLEIAGSSAANVVKAQVYMTHVEDFSAFNEVWGAYFPKDPPCTSLIPAPNPSIGTMNSRIEINLLAVADKGKTKKEIIKTDVFTGYRANSAAIRAGDLLLLSGLMAIDENGLVPEAKINERQSNFQSSIKAQASRILENAQKICKAAGTSLANVVRAQHFHTNLADFYAVHEVWQQHLPGKPIPFSAVEVPSPMPVPGCELLMDLWVYAP
jgi:enamine deaminase RidA (YjgF/YER057c/UK114 family)